MGLARRGSVGIASPWSGPGVLGVAVGFVPGLVGRVKPDHHRAVVAARIEHPLESVDPGSGVLLDPGGYGLSQDSDASRTPAALPVDDPDPRFAGCMRGGEEVPRLIETATDPQAVQVEGRNDSEYPSQERPHRESQIGLYPTCRGSASVSYTHLRAHETREGSRMPSSA